MGLEPATCCLQNSCSNQLSYAGILSTLLDYNFNDQISTQLEPPAGIEPATPSLPWKCSTPELGWLVQGEGVEPPKA